MLGLIENFVFHYEFARYLRQHITGLTWRKAWSYQCDRTRADPIEAAQAELSKMRRRYPLPESECVENCVTA